MRGVVPMSEQASVERRRVAGARPLFHEEDVPELLGRLEKIVRGGRLIFGENTREFEESFRTYVGTRHAVTVNSCTTALEIVMRFYGVRGREVIVPTNTFASCVKAVIYAGGTPVLAGMNPQTFCLDTEDVLRRINPKTAGVLVVHIAGLVYPEIDRLREVCRERGLFLLLLLPDEGDDDGHGRDDYHRRRRAGRVCALRAPPRAGREPRINRQHGQRLVHGRVERGARRLPAQASRRERRAQESGGRVVQAGACRD